MKNSSPTDSPVDMGSERSQLLVRVPTDHLLLAKRMAAREGMSLTDYIDRLIVNDVTAKADEIRAEIEAWRDQARIEAETLADREAAAVEKVVRSKTSSR